MVVTGSSSGIGAAIAMACARSGADVGVHARRSMRRAEEVAARIEELGRTSVVFGGDIGDAEAASSLVEKAFAEFGRIDAWVNNAGADVLTGSGKDLSFSQKLELLLAVDVRGTMQLTREVGERLGQQAGGGSILNMGWDQASTGMEGDSGELFAASKGAIMSFTKSAALSLAPRVRVNCVAPGWIRTAWGEEAGAEWQERVRRETPLARWGTPQDVAAMACFLCSPEADYITGQVLAVNGGAVR